MIYQHNIDFFHEYAGTDQSYSTSVSTYLNKLSIDGHEIVSVTCTQVGREPKDMSKTDRLYTITTRKPVKPQKMATAYAAARIKQIHKNIEELKSEVIEIATANVQDFHWMRGKVSDFWTCEDSPIGYCVFPKDDNGHVLDECQYCGDPQERK